MRSDVFVEDVLAKCEALKHAGTWRAEPFLRPRAWVRNFDPADQPMAALLLDKFSFYSNALTERLLLGAYSSITDGLPKGPRAPSRDKLLQDLPGAAYTRVDGETPNPTDSGNLFCRMARQTLGIPDDDFLEPAMAVEQAYLGRPIVFVDDFIGSGDQFVKTWTRNYPQNRQSSFADAMAKNHFTAAYVALVASDAGVHRIAHDAPEVAVSTVHVLDQDSNVRALTQHPALPSQNIQPRLQDFLIRQSTRINPPSYVDKVFGYKSGGLLLAFEHSVPDASLPIFWSPGGNGWIPLLEKR